MEHGKYYSSGKCKIRGRAHGLFLRNNNILHLFRDKIGVLAAFSPNKCKSLQFVYIQVFSEEITAFTQLFGEAHDLESDNAPYTIGLDGMSLQVNDGQKPTFGLGTLEWVFTFSSRYLQ